MQKDLVQKYLCIEQDIKITDSYLAKFWGIAVFEWPVSSILPLPPNLMSWLHQKQSFFRFVDLANKLG